jgi:glycosyltransferase involved in cell wall biosynthesis
VPAWINPACRFRHRAARAQRTQKIGNIIIIGNSPFRPAGGGILAGHVLRLLRSAGHSVRAIYPIYKDKPEWREQFSQVYPHVQAFWYEMPRLVDVFAGFAAEDLALQARGIELGLRHFLTDQPPELIYLHKESSIWGITPLLVEQGLPFLATLHGNLLAMLNGATDNTQAERWLSAYRQADLVTCCAEHMAVRVRAAGLTNITTVRNGVDTEQFRPQPRPRKLATDLGIAPDDIVVLHASDLKSIKRAQDIVRGFAVALRHDPRLRLLIVGASYMRMSRDTLKAEAQRLGVAERMQIVGWAERQTMPHYYALADMTVQASASEGLSLTCLESMACGRTLIASDIPAARELIRNGVDGLLFPLGDVAALGRAIGAAASDPSLRARLGAAARERIAAHFSLDQMDERLLTVISGLLE